MNKISHLFFILVLCFATVSCMAQGENINTDRPDQSDGTYTIPKNTFQLENGITAAKDTYLNNFMLRYGATTTTEVRLLVDVGKELKNSGLKPVTVSLKQKIWQQRKIIPAITFVGYISFEKLAGKDFQGKKISAELKLAFENELSDKFSLGYNLGTFDGFKNFSLSMEVSYAPIESISTFIEYFSTITPLQPEHNIDMGFLYAVTPNLQFDIAAGHSIFAADSRFYTTFGVSYFFN